MNETYFLKLSGKVNVPEKVDNGHNYRVLIEGSVTSETRSDNQDGSFDIISKFEPVKVDLIKATGETIKAKDPRGWSKKIRSALYRIWEANGDDRTSEQAYEDTMKQILTELGDLYERGNIKR